jgi:hypothetical protein
MLLLNKQAAIDSHYNRNGNNGSAGPGTGGGQQAAPTQPQQQQVVDVRQDDGDCATWERQSCCGKLFICVIFPILCPFWTCVKMVCVHLFPLLLFPLLSPSSSSSSSSLTHLPLTLHVLLCCIVWWYL